MTTPLLAKHGIQATMSRVSNPYDNAKAESFVTILKREEFDRRDDRDADAARRAIGTFIEEINNQERLHSALDYRPPAEFAENLPPFGAAAQRPQMALIATCP